DLNQAIEAYRQLNAVLDEKAGADAPSSSNVRNILNSTLDLVMFIAKDRLPVEQAPEEAPGEEAVGEAGATNGAAAPRAAAPDALETREDAFRLILKAADFFRKHEPHSPLSYSLEDLVRRGRLTLPELLQELIPNEQARRDFLLTAGIKPPE